MLLHDRALLGPDPFPAAARPRSVRGAPRGIVVYGHSHQPLAETRDGVLWFNPGSAGPRRFRLPVSVGRLVVEDGRVESHLLTLDV